MQRREGAKAQKGNWISDAVADCSRPLIRLLLREAIQLLTRTGDKAWGGNTAAEVSVPVADVAVPVPVEQSGGMPVRSLHAAEGTERHPIRRSSRTVSAAEPSRDIRIPPRFRDTTYKEST